VALVARGAAGAPALIEFLRVFDRAFPRDFARASGGAGAECARRGLV